MSANRIITRTVAGAQLQTNRQLGLKHEVPEYTTLNQALNEPTIINLLPTIPTAGMEVYDEYDLDTDSDSIFTKYVVLGNGGHKNINNPNDAVPYSVPVPHLATDTGLFNIMPLVVRPATEDLTIEQRKKYRLRRTIEKDGVKYAAYFCRVLEFPRTTPDMMITTIENGEESSTQFIPTINNLRPSHPEENQDYDGKYASVSSFVTLVFDAQELKDIKDACRILYGNERMAILSELAICSGVEKTIRARYPLTGPQTTLAVAPNTLFEVAACQVQVFITTHIPLAYADQEYSMTIDIGATEPLFGVNVNT